MKKIITLSTIAFLSTALYANADMQTQIDELTKKVKKLEKKQKKNTKKISNVNKLAAKDNIKFDVDFRTAYDNIQYKTASGEKYSNDALYSSRLWLGMGYAPTDTIMFRGQISYHKAFGASYSQRGQNGGFDSFDWIINENLTDDTLKVREAYWLWTPTVGGFETTMSVGRRPATNGYLINLRDDDKAKSPMGHIINMEFDGMSASVKFDQYLSGSYVKLCLGRGHTNASARFNGTNDRDYEKVTTSLDNMDMIGLIVKPYDDGQYSLMTKYYRAFNVLGYKNDFSGLRSFGEMDGAAISGKIEGIGDEINDFLDETIVFASYAWSQTRPKDADGTNAMLGSNDNKSGDSYWIGTQIPNGTGGKFGAEYNHGSKYWRPFTYGEDTMIGSKMAVRGSAYEAYWTQPIIEENGKSIFSMQIRYTYLNYEYTGSNAFFGYGSGPMSGGKPLSMAEAEAAGLDPVDTASDLRIYFRYRY